MGIYIKNMNMPKEGCKDCPLVKRKRVFDICPFLKREVDGNVERGGKPLDCPLLEVKRPHGRLVDADQFLKDMRDLYADHSWDWREVHFSMLDTEMNMVGRTVIGTEGEDD